MLFLVFSYDKTFETNHFPLGFYFTFISWISCAKVYKMMGRGCIYLMQMGVFVIMLYTSYQIAQRLDHHLTNEELNTILQMLTYILTIYKYRMQP
jgi:hypothetical protein